MNYTLYNKRLKRRLTHPAVGLWFTPKFQDAVDMLRACKEYVRTLGAQEDDFVIVEVETMQEVNDSCS